MSRKVRWAVIASGGIARRRTIPEGILPARNAELVAVWGRNRNKNAEVAREFGVRAATTLAELLALDVDAVFIASPNHAHLEQTRLAAATGKHVFCEKPLGLNVREARLMLQACRRAGVCLGTAFMMRHHSQHQTALQLIQEGCLGKPVYARAQLSCWYPPLRGAWRQIPNLSGGGALVDLAGHCIDLLEMFFGPVVTVSCMINHTIHHYATEDSGAVLLRFKNGALATVDTFFCIRDQSSQNRLEVYGSKGGILAENTIGQQAKGKMVACLVREGRNYDPNQTRSPAREVVIAPRPVNTYRAEIEEFSQALLEGRGTQESARRGLRSQIILEACYQSARTRREVPIPNS